MSAFICNETHIATCAAIMKEAGLDALRTVSRADLAEAMARENLMSVAWRYGPEGCKAYSDLMQEHIGQLQDQGWTIMEGGASEEDPLADMLGEGADGRSYMQACRTAAPADYEAEEAYQYLSCWRYQSCEHPEWDTSPLNGQSGYARWLMAERMKDKLLFDEAPAAASSEPGPGLPEPAVMTACVRYLAFSMWRSDANIEAMTDALCTKLVDLQQSGESAIAKPGDWAAECHRLAMAPGEMMDPPRNWVHLSRLKSLLSPAPAFTGHEWLDQGLNCAAYDMKETLLEGRHVWEAPFSTAQAEPDDDLPAP